MTTMEAPWSDKNMLELWLEVPVKEVHSEDTTSKGDNYLSNMKRLEVKTENGEIFPLVVKCRMEEGTVADIFRESSIFRKEQEMYSNILMKMSQLLRDAFPDNFEELAPKSYYTCKCFLVLEDLKAAGFKMEDRRKGLDLDQCLLVMRTFAKFHAASIILHQQNPSIFEKFETSFFVEDAIKENMGKLWSGLTRTLADELETWGEKWHEYTVKLRNLEEDLMDRLKEVTRCRDSDFNVLLHADPWTNNMLFKNGAEAVRFVDFQLSHYGSIGIDFNYFFITSANLDVKRNHKDRLVEEYHSTLCKTLTGLGYKNKLITLEEVHREIDKKAMYGLFTLIGPYAMMQLARDTEFSFEEALSTGWNPGPVIYGETYKEVVKKFLPYYDSKGAFDIIV